MNSSFDPNLLSELIDQSHNPPGGDIIIGNFYAAVVEMIEHDELIAQILMRVKKKRPKITYKHLVSLIFRVVQFIKFSRNDLSYRAYDNVDKWRKELDLLCSDDKTRQVFEKLLRTRSTTTTIYQRYSGPYAIIAYLWKDQAVSVADLGCGGNYGLRGIELMQPFKDIRDLTPNKTLLKLLPKKINLKSGIAIDKEDPDIKSSQLWRIACSFYPHELNEITSIQNFEEKIRSSQKVRFIQNDLLKTKSLPKIRVDVVILSTILYQLTLQEQLVLLDKAKKLLNPEGIIIVQDFAIKNISHPNLLDFNDSWFGKTYSYRTFIIGKKTSWKFWELFQWNNGRCRIARAGEDFQKIFKKG